MFVLHEVERIAAVNVQVGVALGHALHVVHSAHSQDPVDLLGVPEPEAHGVIGAEARARGHDEGIRVERLAEGERFGQQIVVVLEMSPGAGSGVETLVVPAFVMDVVEAEQLDPSLFEMVGQDLVHVAVPPFVTAPQCGRKGQDPGTGVAEDFDVHLPAQGRGEPGVMTLMTHFLPVSNQGRAFSSREPQAASVCSPPVSST